MFTMAIYSLFYFSHLETCDLVQKQNKNTTCFPLALEIGPYLKRLYLVYLVCTVICQHKTLKTGAELE
jgi:hypothetical protein